jgi:hypothetical protein
VSLICAIIVFFGRDTLSFASKLGLPKLKNILLQLQDFATVVEADQSMKAGNIWCCWSVMAQGIKGLTHYSIHLPQTILLITKVLSPGLRHIIQHSLLISPTGRPNHFVAKDFYLENFNYWLKFFYNNNGIGSDSQHLGDVFSLNDWSVFNKTKQIIQEIPFS